MPWEYALLFCAHCGDQGCLRLTWSIFKSFLLITRMTYLKLKFAVSLLIACEWFPTSVRRKVGCLHTPWDSLCEHTASLSCISSHPPCRSTAESSVTNMWPSLRHPPSSTGSFCWLSALSSLSLSPSHSSDFHSQIPVWGSFLEHPNHPFQLVPLL